jgi:hypothetical protein
MRDSSAPEIPDTTPSPPARGIAHGYRANTRELIRGLHLHAPLESRVQLDVRVRVRCTANESELRVDRGGWKVDCKAAVARVRLDRERATLAVVQRRQTGDEINRGLNFAAGL